MDLPNILVLLCFLASSYGEEVISTRRFPGRDTFLIGVATSSYQVEGAWNADGKGENIWDHLCHNNPSVFANNYTGDVTCDSYNKVEEDIAMLKELEVDHYRFSISWSRLLPTGYTNKINQKGIDYYNKLINGLIENNIQPLVTLFHWDTPQPLEEIGGYQNDFIISLFADYARLCFKLFGDRVKYWLTFNEPKQTCTMGYGTGALAPMKSSNGKGEYLCIHNIIRAHAKAWHIYNNEFRREQNGQVGITIDSGNLEPANSSDPADVQAAEDYGQFITGFYINPIVYGDYPAIVREKIDARSKAQGYASSRLPNFTEDEKKYIKGTIDYLGVNCYTSNLVRPVTQPDPEGMGIVGDSETENFQPDNWEKTATDWLRVTPWACANLLRWIQKTYNPNKIIITENGVSDRGTLEDDKRINFYQKYLNEIQKVMDEGVNLIGYTAWSVMDNFEWMQGYLQKFGLYYVDFDDPNRKRTAKKSAKWYKNFIQTRCLVDQCDA